MEEWQKENGFCFRPQGSNSDNDTAPLLKYDVALYEIVSGEESTFRTQNTSPTDLERHNVIERTEGNIHTRVELIDVMHGTYNEEGSEEATLLVFCFRFDPQRNSHRAKHARVNIEFFAIEKNSTGPTVDAISPEKRWTIIPTTDHETITRGGEINASATGVPFLDIGTSAKFERTITRDINDATTITGSINIGTGRNSGESTVAVWNLQENRQRKTGIPDSVQVAVLLHREDSKPFTASVTLKIETDFVSGIKQWFAKVPLDDPILFNPRETSIKKKKGRTYGLRNLSEVDLYLLCEARMGVPAAFMANTRQGF
ncbi:hypothetical protein CFAM422_003608 [Trichoderma lentiforme]|uniref:Uncharacterized protein n=1 Tax=Trichoderma lentiforme TaxID=1567552 RepID=A0A9P4XL80_9HYPO|nr:hypothetical protein CFAM422_003608 [Trichoderma lentiforme]